MELIDTHTHIYEPEFDEDRRQTMDGLRRREWGVCSFRPSTAGVMNGCWPCAATIPGAVCR